MKYLCKYINLFDIHICHGKNSFAKIFKKFNWIQI